MSIKLISFDIGIKNMAYCYLDYNNNYIDTIENHCIGNTKFIQNIKIV